MIRISTEIRKFFVHYDGMYDCYYNNCIYNYKINFIIGVVDLGPYRSWLPQQQQLLPWIVTMTMMRKFEKEPDDNNNKDIPQELPKSMIEIYESVVHYRCYSNYFRVAVALVIFMMKVPLVHMVLVLVIT